MDTPLIEFINVHKSFENQKILNGINLKIYKGQVTTIIGKSGTGKSVTLKHIIGLLKPDAGTILFDGRSVNRMPIKDKNAYLSKISYMFQNNALFDSLTVFDNVAMPLRYTTRMPKKKIAEKVMERIEQTELTDEAYKYPAELSGGMQKRVALARALVTDPEIVLFDEPTTGQDPIRKNAILGMVAEYQRRFEFTAVLISHEIPDVFFISNRVAILYEGSIIFQGPPEELDHFEHPFMDEFIESLEDLQTELSGIYSKRHFRLRYQTDLIKRRMVDTYAVAVFTLEDFDALSRSLGNQAAHGFVKALGQYIYKHFGSVGGFSTRYQINEFTTVLPFTDQNEAILLLQDFKQDFQTQGVAQLKHLIQRSNPFEECVECIIYAGLAQGKPQVELDSIVEFARFQQEEIARFKCEA